MRTKVEVKGQFITEVWCIAFNHSGDDIRFSHIQHKEISLNGKMVYCFVHIFLFITRYINITTTRMISAVQRMQFTSLTIM